MTPKNVPPKNHKPSRTGIAPLDFEKVVRAALATGKPPKRKPSKKKAPRKPLQFYEVDRAESGAGWAVYELDAEGGERIKAHTGFDSEGDAEWWARLTQEGRPHDWSERRPRSRKRSK